MDANDRLWLITYLSIMMLTTFVVASTAGAQGVNLTREDRLAILYSPQLPFTTDGEPLIKIGITDDEDEIRFVADTAVTVLPLGAGGPEVELPAGTEMTVTIDDGQSGSYLHSVVVAEFGPDEQGLAVEARNGWRERGYDDARAIQLGSIFAVAGQSFDTRRILIAIGETDDDDAADDLADALQRDEGLETWVHDELVTYPGGDLTLGAAGVTIRHRDLLWVRGDEETVFTVRDVDYDRGTRYEGSEDRQYVGSLIFSADRRGRLSLVNEVRAERLLEGILPAEVYASAPAGALQAQAVAARSELLTDLGSRHLADPFMTCSDQRCQVYRGIGHEAEATTEAVEATRGHVLTVGDQIINAFYSSNNGGFAAANDTTWGVEAREYLRAHVDVLDPPARWEDGLSDDAEVREFIDAEPEAYSHIDSFSSGRFFRWTESLEGDALHDTVNARYDVGTILELEVLERGFSGRVSQLRIRGTQGEVVVERELNVRRAFGGLRSALFVMDVRSAADGVIESVTFRGAGFGHGVGLCQTGAIGAAERGVGFDEILAHYYPGTVLRELY